MPNAHKKGLRWIPSALWSSLIASFFLGLWLLATAPSQPNPKLPSLILLILSLRHDLGIALCISTVIGSLFELYRSRWLEIANMRDVIDYVMGDKLTPEVWTDVIDQLEGKVVIRQEVELRLELHRPDYVENHQAVLGVEHKYAVCSLRDRPIKYEVRHELDYQFSLTNPRLPKWEQVDVTPPNAVVGQHPIALDGRDVTFEVSLPSRRHGESVVIRTRRVEIVPLPGSYNFYVPEFMRGIHLQLIGCPPGFRVETVIRPHGGAKPFRLPKSGSWTYDGLIFPGQGIEVKFIVEGATEEPPRIDAVTPEEV